MSNEAADERVAELEKRISEMEATIRGLTEELVDANTRIRKLEEREGMHQPMDRVEHETVTPEGEEPDQQAGQQAGGRGEDDAAQQQARSQMEGDSGAEGAEASKDDGANEEAESEDPDVGDDIIVA